MTREELTSQTSLSALAGTIHSVGRDILADERYMPHHHYWHNPFKGGAVRVNCTGMLMAKVLGADPAQLLSPVHYTGKVQQSLCAAHALANRRIVDAQFLMLDAIQARTRSVNDAFDIMCLLARVREMDRALGACGDDPPLFRAEFEGRAEFETFLDGMDRYGGWLRSHGW